MKIRGLFHKLLKSKYNSHFHYYCIIKSCSRNVSKKGYMACKNQRCSNPLPRRGGKQAASEQCQTSSCSSLQRSSGGSGKTGHDAGCSTWMIPIYRLDCRAARSVSRSEGALSKMVFFRERADEVTFGQLCGRSNSPYGGRNPKHDSSGNKPKICS